MEPPAARLPPRRRLHPRACLGACAAHPDCQVLRVWVSSGFSRGDNEMQATATFLSPCAAFPPHPPLRSPSPRNFWHTRRAPRPHRRAATEGAAGRPSASSGARAFSRRIRSQQRIAGCGHRATAGGLSVRLQHPQHPTGTRKRKSRDCSPLGCNVFFSHPPSRFSPRPALCIADEDVARESVQMAMSVCICAAITRITQPCRGQRDGETARSRRRYGTPN
eukprot:scaffold6211_cov118-Isochrysis_galbana.AAC.7